MTTQNYLTSKDIKELGLPNERLMICDQSKCTLCAGNISKKINHENNNIIKSQFLNHYIQLIIITLLQVLYCYYSF